MKISVVGSVNIDRICLLEHLPLKGETISAIKYDEKLGGKGANQAVCLAKLGADVTFFGAVGNDQTGIEIKESLFDLGVNVDHVKLVDGVKTGAAFVNIGNDDNTIIIVEGANSSVSISYMESAKDELLKSDVLLLQNEIPMETVEYLIDEFSDKIRYIFYNPAPYKDISKEILRKINYIIPNETEYREMSGKYSLDDIKDKILVTLGDKGVKYFDHGADKIAPASKCTPIDTTGAGDTFFASFAYFISQECTLLDSITYATIAAGIATEKVGAQENMPSLQMINERSKRLVKS